MDVNDISNCSDSTFFAVSAGMVMYRAYLDSVRNTFNEDYIKTTLTAGDLEQFAVTYSTSEYHYTLYYYDQAGNLVKTVPPAGVVKNCSTAWLDQVKVARRDNLRLVPAHKMVTAYKYNTLNQVVAQKTPDAGQSHFWYDKLGRIVTSQNAKQVIDNNYSYTLFDDLGRITEVGELTSSNAMTDEISRKASALNSWINAVSCSKTQITQTVYDQPLTPFGGELWNPVNLRNRVSWSAVYNTYADVLGGDYVTGSFYTYDILGNVKTLLQDYKTIVTSKQADRWKRINYDYDQVSGKVNMVSYQAGNPDAFYHRYSYDAENRITGVATSHDSVYWENDAYYQYYKHGPLARSVIGQQQVQGIDYAYTLQGWLKGVNSTALTPAYDMGGDGSMVAKDAFGFALHYFGNEYSAINSSKAPFANPTLSKPLFNGNIAAISQHLPTLGAPLISSYSYDVLNRLVGMQVANGLNTSTNNWTPVALDDYKEKISYDANGNILTYSRNGNKAVPDKAMDRLAYTYKAGTNQLDFITDSAGATVYDNDIDSQLSGNYAYDSIGNLVKDNAGGISEIKWTVYGKIASIRKADNTIINYAYDVAENRISKKVNDVQTWYVRDATGNVMSIYTKGDPNVNGEALTQTEIDLYGSSRLGINTLSTNVETTALATTNLTGLGNGINISFIRGKKFFELSNHLGNVLATVSDKKLGVSLNGSIIDYYIADIVSAQEYYPFGMQMPGRGISSSKYRYGFNGKENDNEVKGEGNLQDYGMRGYDPRLGRFLSVDPISQKYPMLTPYQFAGNGPIFNIDLDGAEPLASMADQIRIMEETNIIIYGRKDAEKWNRAQRQGIYLGSLYGLMYGFYVLIAMEGGPEVTIPLLLSDLTQSPVLPSPQAWARTATTNTVSNTASKIEASAEEGSAAESVRSRMQELRGGAKNINVKKGVENCAGCTIAGDAALNGYPASALNVGPQKGEVFFRWYGGIEKTSVHSNLSTIENLMKKAGDGATGVIMGGRADGSAHYFNVVNQEGKVIFMDFQQTGNKQVLNPSTVMKTEGYQNLLFLETTQNH